MLEKLASTQVSTYYSSDQVYLIHIVNSQYCVIHQLLQESVENRLTGILIQAIKKETEERTTTYVSDTRLDT